MQSDSQVETFGFGRKRTYDLFHLEAMSGGGPSRTERARGRPYSKTLAAPSRVTFTLSMPALLALT